MQMKQRYGRGFSAVEKTELWDRWRRGESLKAIGRAFGKPSSSIYFQLAPHGGIRPSPRCPLAAGVDLMGTRGDIPRDRGPALDPIDGVVAGPVAVDGEPGSSP